MASHDDDNNNNINGTGQPNGISPTRRKPVWRNVVENFSPLWFTLAMNTGILGVLFHQQPWQFDGLYIISTIMYVFTIILFAIFSIITVFRWTVFHRTTVSKTHGDINEISLLGTAPIAWFTITALTALIPSNAYWGHHAFTILAVVMWWFGSLWMVVTCIGVCIAIAQHDVVYDRTMSTALFLPAVGVATDAVVGGLICNYAYGMTARLAVPILITSYFLDGLAVFVSLEIYTLFFHRLMTSGWPEPAKLPGLILLVGPFGQTAAALLLAGSAASTAMDFPHYDKGTFLTMMGAEGVTSAGTLIALLLLGHDFFWIVVACGGIGVGVMNRTLTYSLLWWATIFPLGTCGTEEMQV